ncbi:MAG: flagellar hook-associated protein FlgK [Chloroflexota bacterium]|nr:MAG: flagellar hook-associated protein FlgK [Chloroflexota bacterium]
MTSTFFGLQTAARALSAQQQALDTTSHNISNANTPGYTRQRVELAATPPYTVVYEHQDAQPGQFGTGVEVTDISRSRDAYLDLQFRKVRERLGEANARSSSLSTIERTYGEPTDSGIGNALDVFWTAWQDVSNHPEDLGVRQNLVEQGRNLTSLLNQTYNQLQDIGKSLETDAEAKVQQINDLTSQIATLNATIRPVVASGKQANDLRDQRDVLMDKLSQLVHVTYLENGDGSVNIALGDRLVVDGDRSEQLNLVNPGPSGGIEVHWSADDTTLSLQGGELKGIMDSRNTVLPGKLAELDALAAKIIQSVNDIHTTGYTLGGVVGGAFFTGTGASDIAVSEALEADPNAVAAAATAAGVPGDGSVALRIAQLQKSSPDGSPTINATYQQIISRLGNEASQAEATVTSQQAFLNNIDENRQSANGVSLDEEMINLVKYQRGYQAAARLVNMVDETLDTIVNRLGLSGR